MKIDIPKNIRTANPKPNDQHLCWRYLTRTWRLMTLVLKFLWVSIFSRLHLFSQSQKGASVAQTKVMSQLQRNYRDFFLAKLTLHKITSPAQLSIENKQRFFEELHRDWQIHKIPNWLVANPSTHIQNLSLHNAPTNSGEQATSSITQATKRRIKSEANKDQTNKLKILFRPNNYFKQDFEYHYPVIKMPKRNSRLKLPRAGRSNQMGYKELDFFNQIKLQIRNIAVINDVHMVIPHYSNPYEPDIVLFDKRLNLYIDIEIDEPYDGYYRHPTHYINSDDKGKKDNIRDQFFTDSGWIVVRFTEKQVHCHTDESIALIKNLLNSIYNRNFSVAFEGDEEEQWDYNQCIAWQKEFYREKYLAIDRFKKRATETEIVIDVQEKERIEKYIKRTKIFTFKSQNNDIEFDEESHTYIHPKDKTGNAEYISVTTAIERFFPFDQKRYVARKASAENRTEEEVLADLLQIGKEASDKGTLLHNQIESFFNGDEFDADSTEFDLFLNFYNNEIKKRSLLFFAAEMQIFSNKYNIAGTIDTLFKKTDKDEYVMLDWKRSGKLIIDGRPRIFGYGYALSELAHLDNSSYYKYCLQQNIYKIIVETEFSIKISSMKLVVLHEKYSTYHVINVPEMKKEAMIILNSLTHKI